MPTEYSGGGDPKRTIDLLWGRTKQSKRGPKLSLSGEEIARRAIAIADAEGLAAVTMRRVAEELGVTAMSLYTYFPGKSELLDVMVDLALGHLDLSAEVGDGWRAKLEHVSREKWAMWLRHPWMLEISPVRPVMGPNLMARFEYELRAVDGLGLEIVDMDRVVSLVEGYVHGAARGAVDIARGGQLTGATDQEWFGAFEPHLREVAPEEQFPLAWEVGEAAAEEYGGVYPADNYFEFGLARILDGIEAWLLRQQGSEPD
jgi:AcrR family transcriptional regulator